MGEPEAAACGNVSVGEPCNLTLGLVVTCHSLDRLEDALRLIDSIGRQTSLVDEVVVVVQQSRQLLDALRPPLERLTRPRVTVRFLESARGVSHARNEGLAEVQADIVAFVDDDAILFADWAAMTRVFYGQHPQSIGVAGAILPMWDSPAMEWFPRELYWMLSCTYWKWTSPMPVRNGYGANMSFRREAFDGRRFSECIGIGPWGVGGWRGVGGEEPELALRVTEATGRAIFYVPDVRVWHRVRSYRLRWRSLARRAYWEGRLKGSLPHAAVRKRRALDTEKGLLRDMARASIGRLRLLGTHPLVALRQEALVLFVVGLVGCGFLEGRVRRMRVGGASPAG